MKKFKKILIALVILFLILQIPFFQPTKNFTEAEPVNDITTVYDVPKDIQNNLHSACYDCHSNYTKDYPWYSNIQPVSWWLDKHIVEAKKELNFSEFANYSAKRKAKKFKEIAEEMEEKTMPLPSYTLMHKHARLSDAAIKDMIDWARKMYVQVKADSTAF
ncbi:MAG: heme-binding domain-containing protein [Chitinophagaceae bacterium]|nr:heme-binding domain-containing protein [Chitinophagaceae bacterium]MCW5905801.1 heme-binding domain-containing protein [Chitinophagaceae bacterium]